MLLDVPDVGVEFLDLEGGLFVVRKTLHARHEGLTGSPAKKMNARDQVVKKRGVKEKTTNVMEKAGPSS